MIDLDISILDMARLPRHVAVIMDGNGRWAQSRGMSRVEGHKRGKDSVRTIVEATREIGIPYLSLFAFSTENWDRPPREVNALMSLLRRYLRTEIERLMHNEVRVVAIGDIDRLPASVRAELDRAIERTRDNTKLTVGLCVSYGGREDIVQAVRAIGRDIAAGRIAPDDVDEAAVSAALGTAGMPDPDLLIRTSGEMRISNFYLWQLAYTEIYVTETLWPEFREAQYVAALAEFQRRERRFGRVIDDSQADGAVGAARHA